MRVKWCAGVVLVAVVVAAGGGDALGGAAKGEGPQTVAVGFGSIWVGTGSGTVLRMNSRTGRLEDVFEGNGFVHALKPGFGSMWALRDRVARIDPRSGFAYELPETASATTFDLEVGARAVWVADDGRNVVDRIDPQRTRRITSVRIPGRAWGLAGGHGQVLVVSAPTRGSLTGPGGRRELRRIDPATNRLSSPLVRLECDPVIEVGRHVVWTIDPCRGILVRRDPRTLVSTLVRRIPRWGAPVLGFGSLWVAGSRWLARIDPMTLRVIARIRLSGASPVVGEGALWLLDYRGRRADVIHRVDPHTNRVATIRIPTP